MPVVEALCYFVQPSNETHNLLCIILHVKKLIRDVIKDEQAT